MGGLTTEKILCTVCGRMFITVVAIGPVEGSEAKQAYLRSCSAERSASCELPCELE